MRFPYLGSARVKYLISMVEHRRQLRRLRAEAPKIAPTERRSAAGKNSNEAFGPLLPKANRLDSV